MSSKCILKTNLRPVTTYVFNKEPARIFVDQKFERQLEQTSYDHFYVDMVPNAVYHWQASFDRKVDIKYVGKTKSSDRHVFYEVEDVTKQSGTYAATEASYTARFELRSSKKASGSFRGVVSWPYWDVTSVKPVAVCKERSCDWVFSDDPATDDTNLWFVSVNEGKSTYHVGQVMWHKFVSFFFVLSSSVFHPHFLFFLCFVFLHSLALWIPLTVVFILLGLIVFFGGIFVYLTIK